MTAAADATTKDTEKKQQQPEEGGKKEEEEEKKMSVVETLMANVNMLETFALATAERREAGAARITGQVRRERRRGRDGRSRNARRRMNE